MEDIKAILNSIKKHTDVEADKGVTRCLPHVILPKKRINQLK